MASLASKRENDNDGLKPVKSSRQPHPPTQKIGLRGALRPSKAYRPPLKNQSRKHWRKEALLAVALAPIRVGAGSTATGMGGWKNIHIYIYI